jgi:hypothetical protein
MADDWAAFERLLRAAHKFAAGHKIGISKEELEKLRQELARTLEMMDEESKDD